MHPAHADLFLVVAILFSLLAMPSYASRTRKTS
jgi:hypothetical protein